MSFSGFISVCSGAEGGVCTCEADVSNGLPAFHMVGYLSSEVKEAYATAIRTGPDFPAKKMRTVINSGHRQR